MKDLSRLASIMRHDWDRRIKHDFKFWMSDGYESEAQMWASGARDLEILTRGLTGTETQTVLEIGCGVGRLLKPAAQKFSYVVGLDISKEAVEKAKGLLGSINNISLVCGSGVDLEGIEDTSVDCVLVFAALSCVPTAVFASYLLEINRVLRPGGALRVQVYVGQEQAVGDEDTLHIRCYQELRLRAALSMAGFELQSLEDLVLPIEVSSKSLGINAKILCAQKKRIPEATVDQISKTLTLEEEGVGKKLDHDIEYWMSVNFAKMLVDEGDIQRAKLALEYAASVSKATSIDVSDLLGRIVKEIEKQDKETPVAASAGNIFQKNLELLKHRFPRVASLLSKRESVSDVSIKETKDGPVLFYRDQCLDHPEKPIQGGDSWVTRSMRERRFQDCEEITVVGFGGGYHVDSMIRLSGKTVSVIEPSLEVFRNACELRDLTPVLQNLSQLFVGELSTDDRFHEGSELFIRPQSVILYEKELSKIKERFYGVRGLRSLHPTILVLGPMQGGTLPILGYTTRALASLHQRVREADVSAFAGGYHALNNLLKEPQRQQAMHGHFIEFISQGVLEAAIEKKADIIICLAQAPISGRVLTELKARGIITVLWFMEDYLRFTYWKEMAKFYDFVFTIQRGECLDLIKQAGAGEVHYIPAACDPVVHLPVELTEADKQEWGSPISFVGAGYHNRQQVFASFAEMPFKIWGTEWPTCKPFDRMVQQEGRRLSPEEYVKIFNATDINVNLHSSTERDGVDPHGDFVNPRTFELAACGAFQLCDERSHLGELFEEGQEIITFKNTKDLKEKIAYYLNHPEERKAISQRAREKVLRSHTYGHRLKEMLSVIYSSKYEHLKNRLDSNPWRIMLERSKKDEELHGFCKRAFERGEEPILDGLIADIMVGQGKLTATEQKLLFLHHVRKQIIRMKAEEAGS